MDEKIQKELEKLGLGNYIDNFKKANISKEEFVKLTDEKMKEIGISVPEDRKKLTDGIKDIASYGTIPIAWQDNPPTKPELPNQVGTPNDYNTLLLVGKINSFLGWIIVVIGAFGFIGGIMSSFAEDIFAIIPMGIGLLIALVGILVVASGQVFSCFVSIERNSKATVDGIQKILEKMN
jgi:hypothetical protein